MRNKFVTILIVIFILSSAGLAGYIYFFKPDLGPLDQSRIEYQLTDKYKFYYNGNTWKFQNNGTSGITLSNLSGVTINITTSKVNFSSLDEVLADRLKDLNKDLMDIFQTDATVNAIKFKYLQIRPKDKENFQGDNIDAYAALFRDNVYFVGMIVYKDGQDITDAKSTLNTIREN